MIPVTSKYFFINSGYTDRIVDDQNLWEKLNHGCKRVGLRPLFIQNKMYRDCSYLFTEVDGTYVPRVIEETKIPSPLDTLLQQVGHQMYRGIIILERLTDMYNLGQLFNLLEDLDYCHLGSIVEMKLLGRPSSDMIEMVYIEYDSESG